MSEEAANQENYFKVPCELQIRFRPIGEDELQVFRSYAMRPSPYSTLKADIDLQLSSMDIREESKALFEKAFQILLNMDQRLERIEEQMHAFMAGDKPKLESYEWVHGELGAGGLHFKTDSKKQVSVGENLLLDMILPALPEHRVVAAAKLEEQKEDKTFCTRFIAIHDDDKEFLHRFVVSRERELLRLRALERERLKHNPDA